MAEYPSGYRFTEEHEWIDVDGDVGTVGITDHAQSELGDVVYIELPSVGDRLGKGEPFGSIESVKAVSELYAPVSGEVVEVHDELVERPELVNEDPHGDAWMIRLRLDDPDAVGQLMSAEDYRKFLAESEED